MPTIPRNLRLHLFFHAICNKNAGKVQQKARGVRLYGRKFPLSAIFCCGFGAGKYYYMKRDRE
jgi:hypothetical protein